VPSLLGSGLQLGVLATASLQSLGRGRRPLAGLGRHHLGVVEGRRRPLSQRPGLVPALPGNVGVLRTEVERPALLTQDVEASRGVGEA